MSKQVRKADAKKAKNTSVAKRIRDIKRLLSKETLDPKMRQSLEKKLALLEQESGENKRKLREQKYAVRYHKVRFFERIKLERKVGKLQKALKHPKDGDDGDDGVNREETRRALQQAREDLEYVLHFPKGEKYVSLLKDAEDAEAQAHLEIQRKRLRAIVKQQLRDDAIMNEMDEGEKGASEHEDGDGDAAGFGMFDQEIREDDFFANSSDDNDDDDDRERDERERGSDREVGFGNAFEDDSNDMSATSSDDDSERDDEKDKIEEDSGEDSGEDSEDDAADELDRHASFQKQPPPRGEKRADRHDRKPNKKSDKNSLSKRKPSSKAPSKGKDRVQKRGPKQPLRTRAEGGRKRRPKKK